MENEKQSEKDYTEFVNLLNKHKVDYLVRFKALNPSAA